MEKNFSSDLGKLRFVAVQVPFYGMYGTIYPLQFDGHWSIIGKAIVEKFNWNYEGKIVGGFHEGNESGVLGFLTRNESDVTFMAMDQDYADFRYIDYSPVVNEIELLIVSSDTTFESTDFAFVYIYSSWVWLAWGVCFILLIAFCSFSENILPKYIARYSSDDRNNGLNCKILDTFRVLLNQGTILPPPQFGHQRLAVICWVFGCFVLNVGFTGGLLSKLTLPPKPIYINTLEDILNHPNLILQVLEDSSAERNIKRSTAYVEHKAWERIQRFNSIMNMKEFDFDLLNEKISIGEMVAFEEMEKITEIWPNFFDCKFLRKIHISSSIGFKNFKAVPIRKNLYPRKAKIIKQTVQSLFEADLISKSINFEIWKNSECFAKDPIQLRKVQLSAFRVVIYGLMFGYLFSIITLILEFK